MITQLSADGTWHSTFRENGRVYLGYGTTRQEAFHNCVKVYSERNPRRSA